MFSFRSLYLCLLFSLIIGLDISLSQSNSPSQVSSPVIIIDHRPERPSKDDNQSPALKKQEALSKKDASTNQFNLSPQEIQSSKENNYLKLQEAWLSKYQLKRNTFILNDGKISSSEKVELEKLINESKESINGSFAFTYMQLREKRNQSESLQLLKNAISIEPSNVLLSAEMAWIAERNGDLVLRNKALSAYRSNGYISYVQMKYASWMLDAIPTDGLIITNGENDTYPIWLSNTTNKAVISLAMLEDVNWLNKTIAKWDASINFKKAPSEQEFLNKIKKSEKPSYLAWTIRPDLLKPFSNQLFPIGPLLQLNDYSGDNLNRLQEFYFSDDVKAYLSSSVWKNDKYAAMLGNLIPGIQMLLQGADISASQRIELQKLLENISNGSKNAQGR